MGRKRTQTPEQRRAQVRAAQRRYRARHRDELNARQRERRRLNIARTREQQRRSNKTYRETHRDELRARFAEYRAANRSRLIANIRKWRLANLDRVRALDRERSRLANATGTKLAYMKEWRRRNPDRAHAYLRASFHKRRMQIGSDSFTSAEWRDLMEQFEGCCAYCGRKAALTVDHRLPLSRGGQNVILNVLPACKSCNSRKGTKTEIEFRRELLRESAFALASLFSALTLRAEPAAA